MHILVINCGSSSIKAAIIQHQTGEHVLDLKCERLGEDGEATVCIGDDAPAPCPSEPEAALKEVIPRLLERAGDFVDLEGVGHRVVHGGDRFVHPVRVDDEVVSTIEELIPLAPLHNPANLAGIRVARELLPELCHVAVFDTAFHGTLPRRARTYAIPQDLADKHSVRRFGFHGTSHAYVAQQAADFMEQDLRDLRVITCHLGSGCSVCAVEYGRSIETSMGMTPLEGVVMGTRSGDIDPGAILHLMREEGMSVDEIDHLLNRESGLAGLSGVGNDMRDIERRASEGDEQCRLAIQVFCHQIRKYIGAYAAVMGGVDAIVFTGGIGENSRVVRHRIAQRLDFLGARFDEDLNRDAAVGQDSPVAQLHNRRSRVSMFAVATDELHAIAEHTAHLAEQRDATSGERTIPVAISARHVHLTQETVEKLFGEGHQLTELRPLSQPGQFACEEQVTLVGPKRTIEGVRILGPTRSANQVEIARTDEFFLGVDAPVRASGDVANTPGITLVGTDGRTVQLEDGVICAWRHIHMTPEDAEHFGVEDKDIVEVEVGQDTGRRMVFGDVLVRVKPTYKLEMHIDTDEGNAAELPRRSEGVLTDTEGTATLKRRHIDHDRG